MYSCPLHNWYSHEIPCPACQQSITTAGSDCIIINPCESCKLLQSQLLQAQKEIKYLNDDMKFNIDLRVTEINKLKSEVEYRKARCEAAELYIDTRHKWDAGAESNSPEAKQMRTEIRDSLKKWQALKQPPIK